MNYQPSSDRVYVAMCCDPLHHGHIALVQRARQLGRVIIGLLTDQAIETYKGPPLFRYEHRKLLAEGISDIAGIVPQHSLDYVPNLLCLRPTYVVHGTDWRSGVQSATRARVIQTLQIWGGRLVEFPYTEGISSSLLRRILRGTSASVLHQGLAE